MACYSFELTLLNSEQQDFALQLQQLLSIDSSVAQQTRQRVAEIIAAVKTEGDAALLRYTQDFDRHPAESVSALRVPLERAKCAWQRLPPQTQADFQLAVERIRRYSQAQKLSSWQYEEEDGSVLGQVVTPLDAVGVYVPGGKAAYPSSVLMNVVPAKVAGVARIVMVVPAPDGVVNEWVLAAAHLCGVDEIWQIGGAQAVAALAYGTQSIVAVDKITGPGNQYVAEAKRAVFGTVGIDMIAGPSEVLVYADDSANVDWIIADLFAQAEHDELAQSILLTKSTALAARVQARLPEMLAQQPRKEVIAASLCGRGAIIVAADDKAVIDIINQVAAEHLELMCDSPDELLPHIRHAGAIFVGERSNEVFGDYLAGTNHVLPTSRSARFSNPLGAYDFQKRSSVLRLSKEGAEKLAPVAKRLALGEGLAAHALSAELREKTSVKNEH